MSSYLVTQNSHGSAVVIMVAYNAREPMGFGVLSEHLHPEALHITMPCNTQATALNSKTPHSHLNIDTYTTGTSTLTMLPTNPVLVQAFSTTEQKQNKF